MGRSKKDLYDFEKFKIIFKKVFTNIKVYDIINCKRKKEVVKQ